tara:strand:- start:52 stop:510 length:459 start_codon:yes stop_codon:yes gene_type:complete
MAKPMRVCDREIVERVICNKYEESKTDAFTKNYENSNSRIKINHMLNALHDYELDLKILNDKIADLNNELEEQIKFYNDEYAGIQEKQGNYNSYYNDAQLTFNKYNESKVEIYFNFPRKVIQGIQDEIGLVTMGGDFDVNELITQLTKQFVK